jgi:hypothetical protein
MPPVKAHSTRTQQNTLKGHLAAEGIQVDAAAAGTRRNAKHENAGAKTS